MFNRLHTELYNLINSPKQHYKLSIKNNIYWECQLEFKGPENTQYANGDFVVTISIPESYKVTPPTIRFDTKIYHVNVDPETGNFSPNILSSYWTENSTLEWVIETLIGILKNPIPEYYANQNVYSNYYTDYQQYYSFGQQWTSYYSPSIVPNNYNSVYISRDTSSEANSSYATGGGYDFNHGDKSESIKIEQNIEIDNKHFPCCKCGFGEIDLVLTGCRHTYHLKCFNNFCDKCNINAEINPLPKKSPKDSGCRYCGSDENLLLCNYCNLNTCFLCISSKLLPDCCENCFENLGAYDSECPACNCKQSYEHFLPIKCRQHPLLCKKCLSLSISIKCCVLGCKLPTSFSDNRNCELCNEYKKPFYSEYKCKNDCRICETCQWSPLLNNVPGIDPDCVGCNDPLVR